MSQPATKPKTKKDVRDIRAEALKIANSIKIEGQDKATTKAIANGVQRGIELFMRQHSEKARELDKRAKKVKQLEATVAKNAEENILESIDVIQRSSRLPWVLLVLSWCLFIFLASIHWLHKA